MKIGPDGIKDILDKVVILAVGGRDLIKFSASEGALPEALELEAGQVRILGVYPDKDHGRYQVVLGDVNEDILIFLEKISRSEDGVQGISGISGRTLTLWTTESYSLEKFGERPFVTIVPLALVRLNVPRLEIPLRYLYTGLSFHGVRPKARVNFRKKCLVQDKGLEDSAIGSGDF